MKSIHTSIAALVVIFSAAATGAEITIVSPTELPSEALAIVAAPHGWRPFISSPMYLHNAAPIFGPPERLGRIIGRTIKGQNGESTVQYDDLASPPPEGVWLVCDYGEANQFSIAKKLPEGIQACTVKYKKGEHGGQNDLDITCK